jgi:ABC-type multidrug transport system ATPase subunit
LKKLSKVEPLIVNKLLKKFKKDKKDFIAVNYLTFGVAQKECFGLLGLNGAGKTTTFKILTGEIDATSGNAFINGYDINKDTFNARKNLGFCPQFDYLPEFLTVKQTFKLFSNLRGLESKDIDTVIDEFIKVFKLKEFEKKLVQNLR